MLHVQIQSLLNNFQTLEKDTVELFLVLLFPAIDIMKGLENFLFTTCIIYKNKSKFCLHLSL